ncbi:hypothetical protein INR49_020513 [Caranx melampygus]|nr:hypothetical protein INR49_020513 [Caranx melampygus]
MGGGGALGNGNSCGNGGGGGQGAGLALDGVCRDFIRNVCKRGKRCRFRHPDFNEVPDLGVQKNEFIFCHDYQNKECMRSNCRFVHGSKEDEDYYKKTGELPLRLRGKVAARLGLSPMDLPHSRGEVPICRDFLTGECQRGNKCKFRHVKKDYEYEPSRVGVGGVMGPGASGMVNPGEGWVEEAAAPVEECRDLYVRDRGSGRRWNERVPVDKFFGQRRYDRSSCSVYDPLLENGLFDAGSLEASMDHTALQLKRRRLEGLRLADGNGSGHYELGVQAALPSRPLEYRFLEEENSLLRKRVEELKKQEPQSDSEDGEKIRFTHKSFKSHRHKRGSPGAERPVSEPGQGDDAVLHPCAHRAESGTPVGAVSSYNHSIAQTHTTLSSAGLQPRPVTQQDLVAPTGAPAAPPTNAAPPTAPPPHLNPEITPLSAALAQTIGMAPPVSMAPVAVSVAPVAVSMTQPLPGITMSHATTPMVSYPIASQSMRITTLPH